MLVMTIMLIMTIMLVITMMLTMLVTMTMIMLMMTGIANYVLDNKKVMIGDLFNEKAK